MDATEEPKIAEQFEVRGYPTLKFFRNGKDTEYNGGTSFAQLLSYLVLCIQGQTEVFLELHPIAITPLQSLLPGRTADTIVSWLEKKTGPAAKTLATVDEAKAFVADNDIAIIGFFDSVDSDGNI